MTQQPARTRPDMDLLDYVHELTASHQHREHYVVRKGAMWYGRDHTTQVPALLAQLVAASPSGAVDERDNSGFGSRPTARLDALDTMARIDHDAATWVRYLGLDDPGDKINPATEQSVPGSGTAACIRLLGSLAGNQPKGVHAALTRDIRRWWTWARIVSGWDSAAWRPDNTCPMCGERRTLRINLAAEVGFCINDPCRETWDSSNIGLLADHIRTEAETEQPPTIKPIPCLCRWPEGLLQQGRWGQCPVCGSHCCVNAEAVAAFEEARRQSARDERRLAQLELIARNYQTWIRQRRRAGA